MYQNLVFSGGGIYGYTYVGCIQALNEKDYLKNFTSFAGSSVGSTIAGLLGCGASAQFIHDKFMEFSPNMLRDISWIPFSNIVRVFRKYGYFKGNKAYKWYGDILKELTGNADVTFKQAYDKTGFHLIIVGVSLNRERPVYFDYQSHPDMPVRLAVRISVSIPYALKAIKWDNDVWVDGGIINNFPISCFDPSDILPFTQVESYTLHSSDIPDGTLSDDTEEFKEKLHKTLGIKAFSDSDYNGFNPRVTNLKQYSVNLLDAILLNASRAPLNAYNQTRAISVNAGNINSMYIDANAEERKDLIKRGYQDTMKFISNNEARFQ